MKKYFSFLFLFLQIYLYSVDFVLFTQPKTATHLLKPILTELTEKEAYSALGYHDRVEEAWTLNESKGTFLHLHAPYSKRAEKFLARKNCIVFFVKRDPRDQIVSLLNHYKYINFIDKSIESIPSDEEKLLQMIYRKLRPMTIDYMGWIDSPISCVLDFKNLMGAHGGAATHLDAMEEMRKIATALEINASDDYLEEVYNRHFGKGGSFFKGKVGSWRDYFNERHKKLVKETIGDLLIKLGYEKDYNW